MESNNYCYGIYLQESRYNESGYYINRYIYGNVVNIITTKFVRMYGVKLYKTVHEAYAVMENLMNIYNLYNKCHIAIIKNEHLKDNDNDECSFLREMLRIERVNNKILSEQNENLSRKINEVDNNTISNSNTRFKPSYEEVLKLYPNASYESYKQFFNIDNFTSNDPIEINVNISKLLDEKKC